MNQAPTKSRNNLKAVLFAAATAAATAFVGTLLIQAGTETAEYGWTMFCALPLGTGFVAGIFVRPMSAVLVTTVLSLLLYFICLLFVGLEGIVCVLMASPLILIEALIGGGMGWLFRGAVDPKSHLMLAPFFSLSFVIAAGFIEEHWRSPDRVESVVSSYTVSASPQEAWGAVIAVDEIAAEKPFLLRIGLPVPQRCTLKGTGAGAKRICHFDSGVIEEKIATWNPPHQLELKIGRVTIPGRHWLKFHSAAYSIKSVSPGITSITRTTTYSTKLQPAWYWRHFERLGVEAEHSYLFDSLGLKKGR